MNIIKIQAILFFGLFFQSIYNSQCRNEQDEGWAWASSLRYTVNGEEVLDFEPIHQVLRTRHNALKDLLDEKGNLCVAQLNFVLESTEENGSTILIDNATEIAQDLAIGIPLEKHVFLSGYDKPSVTDGLVKRTFCTDRELESNKSLKEKKLKLRAFQAIQEIVRAKAEPQLEIADPIIIHPNKPYFLDLAAVVERLIERYRGVPEAELPLKARLALQWATLREKNKTQEGFKGRLLRSRLFRSTYQKKLRQRINEWYAEADEPFPRHYSSDSYSSSSSTEESHRATPESSSLFFTNNADSEQRLFYYLDHITSLVDEFETLSKIIDDIRLWYEASGTHKTRLICNMLDLGDTKTRDHEKNGPLMEAVNACKGSDSTSSHDETALHKRLKTLSERCSILKKKHGSIPFRLGKLEEYLQNVHDGFEALLRGKETNHLGLRSKMIPKMDKDKQTLSQVSEESFQRTQQQVRIKNNKMKLFEQDIIDSCEAKEIFASLLKEAEFEVDDEITYFIMLAQECLERNPHMRIAAVVLNIHSTNDICYSCAPDLARESVRSDSFAEFFMNKAHEINLEKKRGGTRPFFRVVYSCSTIRSDIRCQRCVVDTKKKNDPRWERPSAVAFYQHYFPQSVQEASTSHTIIKEDLVSKRGNPSSKAPKTDDDDNPDEAFMGKEKKKHKKKRKDQEPLIPRDDEKE
jgi:hypothetical protein